MTDWVYRVVIDDPGRARKITREATKWKRYSTTTDAIAESRYVLDRFGAVAHVERAPIGEWETCE